MLKKTIFILAPYPESEAPSQRFRFEQYLDLLEKEGFQIEYHPFLSVKAWETLYKPGKQLSKIRGMIAAFFRRFILLVKLRRADFVFIHREASHIGPPVFEWLIAKILRKRIIYDFDDAIWLPNYSNSNAFFHRLKAYWKVKYIIKWAYKVSAGNDYLAEYARRYNPNVVLIPTTIDMENHHNKVVNHDVLRPVIGWTGTHTTMTYLNRIIPVISKLEKDHEFDFVIISNQAPSYSLSSLRYVKWSKESEIEDLAQIQIGIMPLEPNVWAEGKCGFKALQYMSLGAATVLSPVGANKTIVQNGVNGMLVDTEEEWYQALINLLENPEIRKQYGEAGRSSVQNHYSVNAISKSFRLLFS